MKAITLPGVEEYAAAHTTSDPEHLVEVAAETRRLCELPQMMIGPVQARFLQFYLLALQPRAVLEIGTFTGYSSLSMAEVLPQGGHITTCELSEENAAIAQRHIDASPYADRITVRVGPALKTIESLPGPFDFVMLDADQANFSEYLDPLLERLSPNGVIAVDNVLWNGAVIDNCDGDPATDGIHRFNKMVAARPDLVCVLLTIRDGILLIRRAEGRD
ncbi:class I SAM-dependent methyltransferase [Micromonospora sp. CPCC 206060]|uniref:O-methyltransferase n=1 Tax=Micromonospora sp. CPCC 206060 TaxID=3122406 RepID=UPI002FF07AA2